MVLLSEHIVMLEAKGVGGEGVGNVPNTKRIEGEE